jgi:hypothetical protein
MELKTQLLTSKLKLELSQKPKTILEFKSVAC